MARLKSLLLYLLCAPWDLSVLLVAGVSASLATAAALYGLGRLRAEVVRVPQERPLRPEAAQAAQGA